MSVGHASGEAFRLRPGACRALPTEDGGVLVDLDRNLYYTVNHSGFAIWTSLAGGATPEQAAHDLEKAFALAPDSARQAVAQFVGALTQEGLIAGG